MSASALAVSAGRGRLHALSSAINGQKSVVEGFALRLRAKPSYFEPRMDSAVLGLTAEIQAQGTGSSVGWLHACFFETRDHLVLDLPRPQLMDAFDRHWSAVTAELLVLIGQALTELAATGHDATTVVSLRGEPTEHRTLRRLIEATAMQVVGQGGPCIHVDSRGALGT